MYAAFMPPTLCPSGTVNPTNYTLPFQTLVLALLKLFANVFRPSTCSGSKEACPISNQVQNMGVKKGMHPFSELERAPERPR